MPTSAAVTVPASVPASAVVAAGAATAPASPMTMPAHQPPTTSVMPVKSAALPQCPVCHAEIADAATAFCMSCGTKLT